MDQKFEGLKTVDHREKARIFFSFLWRKRPVLAIGFAVI